MPRFPRYYSETLVFHIMTQGINKSYIFKNYEDKKFYIKTMYKIKDEHKIKIISYCIMDNHTHILIETENLESLSKYMLRLNTIYGKYYNTKYKRVGYVFRDRYKSEGIYNEQHLLACKKYIYDNPVKAGICKNAADYLFSNYQKISEIPNKKTYNFIDGESHNAENEEIIRQYLKNNNIKISDLKIEKDKLKELVKILKDEHNISLREISTRIGIGRETIRKIYN